MAIGVGSILTLQLDSADLAESALGPDVAPQPFKFGVLQEYAAPTAGSVLWEDGTVSTVLDVPTAMDDLYDVSAGEQTRLLGKVVRIANEAPEYDGVVIALYRRGSGRPEKALVKQLVSGVYREVVTSNLTVVAGRGG